MRPPDPARPAVRVPLEDELGDVIEKAMSCAGLTLEALAEKSGIAASEIRDAIDYRPELAPAECGRLAAALGLNEVGLCALASGMYPLPDAEGLPFPVWPLRMSYGIGVVNAYAVGLGEGAGLLFDAGPDGKAVQAAWPAEIRSLSAVFITHMEAEHSGGLAGVRSRFGTSAAFVPSGQVHAGFRPMGEGETFTVGTLEVSAFRTPGHCAMHNCYHVRSLALPSARSLLLTGDLIFAGSAGGPYYCKRQLRDHLRRVLAAVPRDTVVAPGHGPMTTAGNELCYNPFVT